MRSNGKYCYSNEQLAINPMQLKTFRLETDTCVVTWGWFKLSSGSLCFRSSAVMHALTCVICDCGLSELRSRKRCMRSTDTRISRKCVVCRCIASRQWWLNDSNNCRFLWKYHCVIVDTLEAPTVPRWKYLFNICSIHLFAVVLYKVCIQPQPSCTILLPT